MINRFIYTLYLFSKSRKLEDHYLISGGLIFLSLQLVILTLMKLICIQLDLSFVDVFFDNRMIYIFLIIMLFFLSKAYAKLSIKRIKAGTLRIKKISPQRIWLFMILSMFFFLIVMIFL